MSGTSVDGIDACLVEITGNGIHTKTNILNYETYRYDKAMRIAILDACNPKTGTVDKVCQLNFRLGTLFANAAKAIANKSHIPITDIDIIGSHGQTIHHLPHLQSTLQIGEPAVIAQETGVVTVADFRTGDVAAGGQGAPLVPYLDFVLFRDERKGRALQNIGGIANVTFLPCGCGIEDVIAFDTGPGNMIIDRITALITENSAQYDEGGSLSAKGKVIDGLFSELHGHPYLSKPPPKTTGREEFGHVFADTLYKDAVKKGIKGVDILATVTAFTASTIAESYKRWILPKHTISEVILSGGGCLNNTLKNFLAQYLPPSIRICAIDEFGISSTAKEALAFAVLANETISGNPNNIPGATGAKEPVIMGKIISCRR
jgi:anhydro-N-acetylmuramic acid kinase